MVKREKTLLVRKEPVTLTIKATDTRVRKDYQAEKRRAIFRVPTVAIS